MILTKEQQEIVNSSGNIKINAVAGSGKTTTIIEYAKARPQNSRILYLAFNRSVKTEAQKKFRDQGLTNVRVETAHSLAHKHIVYGNNYKVRPSSYKTYEIAELLGLEGNGEKHAEYVIANHINRFISYFCNSDKRKVRELNYREVITDKKALDFVKKFYRYIEKKARLLLQKMDRGEIDITHDFYLKKFQLSNPRLNYDYILFDEGQDASACMLDVFLKQKATKVIVGDTHQQIYGWRYAVNSLEKTDFRACNLSTSFRFSQHIADLSMGVLGWKSHLGNYEPVQVKGKGKTEEQKVKAVIGRTNLGLLIKAIEYITRKKNISKIYFEGSIHSYTYAEEGASLYDILNLYNGKIYPIKNPLIRKMRDLTELEDYIEKTEDRELGMMAEIVKEYGSEIPGIIKTIKEKHSSDKAEADVIFSTVHRCKGMEYDAVQLAGDFLNEEGLEKHLKEKKEEADKPRLNEEINLLYVAVTRTRNKLHIPEGLLPKDSPPTRQVHVIKEEPKEEKPERKRHFGKPARDNKKAYSIREVRKNHKGAYQPWTAELDAELSEMVSAGNTTTEMAEYFGRTKSAVRLRIRKLEMKELYGSTQDSTDQADLTL